MSPRASQNPALATATDVLGPWFRTLARSLQTGIVLYDSGGRPVFANPAAGELLGLSPPADSASSLARLQQLVPSSLRPCGDEETAEIEVELAPPAGKRRVLLRTITIEGEGCGTAMLVEDRTRAAALEASLALASRHRLQHYLRAQVHDLKAPLNALMLNAEVLKKSVEEGNAEEDVRAQQIATAETLQREIGRLGRSLDTLLREMTAGEPSTEEPRPFDAGQLARDVARLLRPSAKKAGVRIHTRLPAEPSSVTGDSDKLKEALINLMINAQEAQPEGGEIRLAVRPVGETVRISVEDDGPGLPEPWREKVFEVNFTTKLEGTGIGLSVARSIVEGQRGRLHLESAPGGGLAAVIDLPRTPA